MLTTPAELTEGVAEELAALADLAATVEGDEWVRATRLPGWTVQDNFAHLAGGAHMLLGRPAPELELGAHLTHLRSDVARWMEYAVEARRSWSGPDVAADLATAGAELLAELRARPTDRFDEPCPGPMGSTPPLAPMLSIVLFDWWCHEQDVREALARPGHEAGPVALHARDRILGGLRHTLPLLVAVEAAVDLTLEVTGPDPSATAVALRPDGGSGDGADEGQPSVLSLRADLLTWNALACGRALGRPLLDAVEFDGDPVLAERVLAACPFTP